MPVWSRSTNDAPTCPAASPAAAGDGLLPLVSAGLLACGLAGASVSTAAYNLGVWGATLLLLFDLGRRSKGNAGRRSETLDSLGLAILAYLGVFLVTSLTGLRPLFSLGRLTKMSFLLVAWTVANHVPDRRRLILLLSGLALGAAVSAGHAVYEQVNPGPWEHQFLAPGRVAGLASETIDFSARLSPLLALALALLMFGRLPAAGTALVAGWSSLVACALLFAQARSTWVALCAGLLAAAALTRRWRPLALMLALLLLPLTLRAPLTQRYSTVASTTDESNRYRFDVLRIAAGIARDHPVLGVGRGNFILEHDRRKTAEMPSKLSPHNNYVDLLCEMGLPGLAAFLWIHWAVLERARRARGETAAGRLPPLEQAVVIGCAQGFVTFMAFGLFHSNWSVYLPPAILMALVGLLWGLTSPRYDRRFAP